MAQEQNKWKLYGTLVIMALVVYSIHTGPDSKTLAQNRILTAKPSASSAHDQIEVNKTPATAPSIGGAFTLKDQNGAPFSEQNLIGKYALVFFGFTHCPDMCPLAMTTITEALSQLDSASRERITPVFITVDPNRDTPETIKTYLTSFAPGFVGLTGTHEQIKQAASGYKVFYETAHPEDKDYNVNHSGYIYLLSPDGDYIRHFSHSDAPADMVAGLKTALAGQPAAEEPAPAAASSAPVTGEETPKP